MLWNINVRKQAISDKLQATVATDYRRDGVVSNCVEKFPAECVSEKEFKIGEYFTKLH